MSHRRSIARRAMATNCTPQAAGNYPERLRTWTSEAGWGSFGVMSVTRGTFLKALGKSLPGMVLGGGIAAAAQKVLGKMAAASGTPGATEISAKAEEVAQPDIVQGAKIDF